MIRLYKRRARFTQSAEIAYLFYRASKNKNIVVTSGTLNYIWNLWNSFWRYYFMAYAIGGIDCGKKKIKGFKSTFRQNEIACFYQCIKNKGKYTLGKSIKYYYEITWGDPNVICALLSSSQVNIPTANYVLGLIGTYRDDILDFQKIRNSFIHMNTFGLGELERAVLPRYRLKSGQETINILDSVSLSSNGECFRTLLDSMNACLSYL